MESLAFRLSLKRTLYFTHHTAGSVTLRGTELVHETDEGEKRFEFSEIRRIVLIGRPVIGSSVLYGLMKASIPVDWLDGYGRALGIFIPLHSARELSSADQIAFGKSKKAFRLAQKTILAKVDNCGYVLRNRKCLPEDTWPGLRRLVMKARNPASLRGAEGASARTYFSKWSSLVKDFPWKGRQAHPAVDPVNALLSFGYTLLYNRLTSSLRFQGLDPRRGFFHAGRGTHCALASDLMEELRPLVDTTVLSLVRRKIVSSKDFDFKAGRCSIGTKIYTKVIHAFEDMFAHEYPFYIEGEKQSAGKISLNDRIDDTAEFYKMHILGKADYIPFRSTPCKLL